MELTELFHFCGRLKRKTNLMPTHNQFSSLDPGVTLSYVKSPGYFGYNRFFTPWQDTEKRVITILMTFMLFINNIRYIITC